MVLVVNGVKFYVHRFMLTLSSPVFNTMLKSESKETSNAEITLPGKDADDILNLLKQLYPQERDEITISVESKSSGFSAARIPRVLFSLVWSPRYSIG